MRTHSDGNDDAKINAPGSRDCKIAFTASHSGMTAEHSAMTAQYTMHWH